VQFDLLQASELHRAELFLAEPVVVPESLCTSLHLQGLAGDVAADLAVSQGGARTERTDSGNQDHSRRGVDERFARGGWREMATGVLHVVLAESLHGLLEVLSQLVIRSGQRAFNPERQGLGPDQVIRGERRCQGEFAGPLRFKESQYRCFPERDQDVGRKGTVVVIDFLGKDPA
jgi:hypothetical protein